MGVDGDGIHPRKHFLKYLRNKGGKGEAVTKNQVIGIPFACRFSADPEISAGDQLEKVQILADLLSLSPEDFRNVS